MGKRKGSRTESDSPTSMPPEFAEDWILATTRLKDPQNVELPAEKRRQWVRDVQNFYLQSYLIY